MNSTVRKIGPKKPPVMKLINNCHQKEEWGFFIFFQIYVTHSACNYSGTRTGPGPVPAIRVFENEDK